MVGPGFALVLIYPITKPTNCKCILTIVTFNLRKRVYVTKQIKTFTLILQLITYAITYLKIEENNSENTIFFSSYGF